MVTLKNGYLRVSKATMSASRANRIEEALRDVRSGLRVRNIRGERTPYADLIVELWAHLDNDGRVCRLLKSVSEDG